MKDGIHIPAGVVRLTVLGMAAAIGYMIYDQIPEARRYLKLESYTYKPG